MRIVLVEDEHKTRNGILNMIKQFTAHEVVGVGENGQEGYELVKEKQPDLIISDIRMPVMGGLEMLQKLFDEKVRFNAILLTGYSDFEYARKALQLQVVDYLLKPLDVEDFLKNLSAVETRICNTRIQQVSVEQLLINYKECQEEQKDSVRLVLQEMLHMNDKTELTLFLLSPGRMFVDRVAEFMNCTKELLESLCIENSCVISVPGEKRILVIAAGTERNRGFKNRFAIKVLPELEEIGACTCVCHRVWGIENLWPGVEQMTGWLPYAFSLDPDRMIDEETVAQVRYGPLEYPEHLEKSMIRELRNGNKEKIEEYGNKFIREVADSNGRPEEIRECAVRLIANVFNVAREMKEYFNQEENIQYFIEMVVLSESRSEVHYQLEKFIHMISKEPGEEMPTENGMVMNAVSYIRTNYKEDITLTDVARICRVTPEYLSRIFYRETGINFSAFLQNFRISAAKRMLMTGNYKIYEVAEAVGFHDQKYFIKVFKKLCGVTPSEYRKESRL